MDREYVEAHNRLWNLIYDGVREHSAKNHSGDVTLVHEEFNEAQKPGNYHWTLTYIPKSLTKS